MRTEDRAEVIYILKQHKKMQNTTFFKSLSTEKIIQLSVNHIALLAKFTSLCFPSGVDSDMDSCMCCAYDLLSSLIYKNLEKRLLNKEVLK